MHPQVVVRNRSGELTVEVDGEVIDFRRERQEVPVEHPDDVAVEVADLLGGERDRNVFPALEGRIDSRHLPQGILHVVPQGRLQRTAFLLLALGVLIALHRRAQPTPTTEAAA